MTALEKIATISQDPRSWNYEETLKAINDIYQLASDEIALHRVTRNEAIDECIIVIELLVRDNCGSHTPYYGACNDCGQMDNPDVLPPPQEVISELKKLKEA